MRTRLVGGRQWLSARIKGLHFSLNSVGRQILQARKEVCVSQHVHLEFYKERLEGRRLPWRLLHGKREGMNSKVISRYIQQE